MTEAERRAALEAVAAEVRVCRRCRLHEQRTNAVPGEGHPSTEVLFVGEAPGLNEDRQGRPFVGPAGALLDELLASIGWRRDEVFITNVVKCRPPGNRDPEPDEIAACAPFLRRQVEVLDPALIVTLGRHSMARFMPGAKIGAAHGTVRPAPPESGADGALVFAMYHPAAALHQASLRPTLEADTLQIPGALLEARRRRSMAPATVAGAEPAEDVDAPAGRSIAPALPGAAEPAADLGAPLPRPEPALADGGASPGAPTSDLAPTAAAAVEETAEPPTGTVVVAPTPTPSEPREPEAIPAAPADEPERDQLTLFSPA